MGLAKDKPSYTFAVCISPKEKSNIIFSLKVARPENGESKLYHNIHKWEISQNIWSALNHIAIIATKASEYIERERACIQINAELIDQLLPKISASALKIFLALSSRLEMVNMVVQVSCTELEKATCLGEQTLREGLNELEALKLLTSMGPNVQRKYVLNQKYVRRRKPAKIVGFSFIIGRRERPIKKGGRHKS